MSDREEESGYRVTDRRGRERDAVSDLAPSASSPLIASPGQPAPAEGPPLAGDLRGLFVMLGESALASLGDAGGGDLEQARDLVETLLVLRERTEGRRTEDESRLLDQVLYELQGQFARTADPRSGLPGGR